MSSPPSIGQYFLLSIYGENNPTEVPREDILLLSVDKDEVSPEQHECSPNLVQVKLQPVQMQPIVKLYRLKMSDRCLDGQETPSASVSPTPPIPKKKGRPPKPPSSTVSSEPPKKKARPPKPPSSTVSSDPPKKRGRPPKPPSTTVSSEPPKKKGRPPKPPSSTVSSDPPKKRGRPPKPPSSPVSSRLSSSPAPTKCTLWRRRKREEKDMEVLRQVDPCNPSGEMKPGDPCRKCDLARTAEQGHAYYKGRFFCANRDRDGPRGWTRQRWLEEQEAPGDDDAAISRTTAWRMEKKMEEEGKSIGRKTTMCKLCGQPKQGDFGHSQYHGSGHFCAMYSYKSVERWLAEKRQNDIIQGEKINSLFSSPLVYTS